MVESIGSKKKKTVISLQLIVYAKKVKTVK
jgi:hypothetical protein